MSEWDNIPAQDDNEIRDSYQEEDTPDYFTIFDAPDFTSYIKHRSSARAKETEKKINSVVKAGIQMFLAKDNLADAAALFEYGPRLAKATGDFTDVSETAYKIIEYASAPNSPALIFGTALASLAGQFYRNHELQAAAVKQGYREGRRARKEAKARGIKPVKTQGRPVTIRLFRRQITFHVRFQFRPLRLAGQLIQANTRPPETLVDRVFSNEKLRLELKKQGFDIRVRDNG
jgi:hypothetical protein